MALSEDQIRTAFRMLNIPYAGPIVLVDNLSLNTTTFATYSNTNSAQTRLRAWLTTGMDSDSITKAGSIIDEYSALRGARSIELNQGGVGGVQGITYNVAQQVQLLIGDLENLVPFIHDIREMINGNNSVPRTCGVLC